ncbi:SRPBCC domain-containing protein [Kitasatospora sp. NPDC002965]|uniref:SRPBCC domain-containing protein n=1 Tax=Kitasatospora sp. NPDC002965 TaxID=3154775 RepID=UPI0033B3DFAF
MVTGSIEREIVIAAPRERVWEVLTQAEFLGAWFGADAPAEIDLRPGGRMVLDHGPRGRLPARIERVEGPGRFSFRWSPGTAGTGAAVAASAAGEEAGTGAAAGGSTLVEFTLTREPGNHTRLRMVESGFTALAPLTADTRTRCEQDGTDWTWKLTELACHTERITARRPRMTENS